MKSIASVSILTLALMVAPSARATLLVDPTGGTSLAPFFVDLDDGSALRPLGGSFDLYGSATTSVYIQTNGFLSVGDGSTTYLDYRVADLANAVGTSVVAPLYDDLHLDDSLGDSITEQVSSSYYAATFALSGLNDSNLGHQSVFQATLFTSSTTLRNNLFRPGDIVFSYGALNSTVTDSNFSVGVAESVTNGTGAFGNGTGQFATTTSFLSNFDPSNQALLYRYNASTGTYIQSVISFVPVPEPASFAAIGLGIVAVLRRRRR